MPPGPFATRFIRPASIVQVLKDKWYMKGSTLTNAIKRKPKVLGNIIDW